MKSKPPTNGLSKRANRCLSTAGIPAEKEAVLHALKTGALYPYFRPSLYGRKTHEEVCRWAGLDESFRPPTIPESTRPPVIENGLSARANHCLFRAGIPAEKPAVMQALQTGALRPGKRPVNYGEKTHAELCRWVVSPPVAPSAIGQPGGTPVEQKQLELSFTADRNQLFKAWNAVANLADLAGRVTVTGRAESAKGFDKSKLNNGVLEPLREDDLIQ
jgi:hypothetical protein